MKLNKQIFNLIANFFGLAAPVEKKETESNSYVRKKCKSCDWHSQMQPMCIRHNRAAKPLDTACSKYLKRHSHGK